MLVPPGFKVYFLSIIEVFKLSFKHSYFKSLGPREKFGHCLEGWFLKMVPKLSAQKIATRQQQKRGQGDERRTGYLSLLPCQPPADHSHAGIPNRVFTEIHSEFVLLPLQHNLWVNCTVYYGHSWIPCIFLWDFVFHSHQLQLHNLLSCIVRSLNDSTYFISGK